MKKLLLITSLFCLLTSMAANAKDDSENNTSRMFTNALNVLEDKGVLRTLSPDETPLLTDMSLRNGLVYATISKHGVPEMVVIDPNKKQIAKDGVPPPQ